MNKIQMISINNLRHHPQNPRKNIGDITELAESLKAKGVLQNLTVVPCPDAIGDYWVVIGNRRLEAAKQAGLKELPCLVADMDEKEQFSTMLVENIQRSDLTIPEQAEGFQLMLDMGDSIEEISKKTGFSESTVRRRVELSRFNKKSFEKACENGATLEQFSKISKIKSKQKQNELLEIIGTGNFNYHFTNAIQQQEKDEKYIELRKRLLKLGLKELKQSDVWGSKYESSYGHSINFNEEASDDTLIKKSKGFEFFVQGYNGVNFYNKCKKQPAKKKSAKELEAEKKKKELAKKSEILYQLRQDFIKDLSTRKNIKGIDTNSLEALKKCVISGIGIYGSESGKIAKIYEMDFRYRKEDYEALRKCSADYPDGFKAVMAYYLISGDNKNLTLYCSSGTNRNERIKIIYEFLFALGYEPCDEEKLFI